MHGENSALGHEEIHNGEHALLDLAGVHGAGNGHAVFLEIENDSCFAVHAVTVGIALEPGSRKNCELRFKALKLGLGRTDESLGREERACRVFTYDPDGESILAVSTDETVNNEELAVLHVSAHLIVNFVRFFTADRNIDAAPINHIMDIGGINDKAVIGGPAGIFAGVYHERTGVVELTIFPFKRMLDERCGRKVAVDGFRAENAHCFNVGFHFIILSSGGTAPI